MKRINILSNKQRKHEPLIGQIYYIVTFLQLINIAI